MGADDAILGDIPKTGYRDTYQVFSGPTEEFALPKLEELQAKLAQAMQSFLVEGRAGPSDLADQMILLPGHVSEAANLYDSIVAEFDLQANRMAHVTALAKRLGKLISDRGNLADGQAAEDLADITIATAFFEIRCATRQVPAFQSTAASSAAPGSFRRSRGKRR